MNDIITCTKCKRMYNNVNLRHTRRNIRHTQSIICWCGMVIYDSSKDDPYEQYSLKVES